MAELDEQEAADLLLGDTDPREVALFLVQQGTSMSGHEQLQRKTVLEVLSIMANRRMADETAELARQTARLAVWTRVLAFVAVAGVAASIVVALATG